MSSSAISRAVASGRLFVVHRNVYSWVPPDLLSREGRMAAAVLLGGPGAALCKRTAAMHLGLMRGPWPVVIDVAVRARRAPIAAVRWHPLMLRPGDVIRHRRFSVTSPARTALDLATTEPLDDLLLVMAEAEYRFDVDAEAIAAGARQGHAGSAALRAAAARHTPQLAQTRSELELAFVRLLDAHALKLPQVNHPVGRSTVDAVYTEERVAVELDGVRGHRGERRILRDHRRDLHRRADGFLPLRYHFTQVTAEAGAVADDLRRAGIPAR